LALATSNTKRHETNMTKLNNIDSQENDQFVVEFHVPLMNKNKIEQMRTLLSYCVIGLLAIVMAGCVVSVAPGYTQEQGIYGYSYYYFPNYNFYYSPDINRYWWYQSGGWQYGQQLPPYYNIDPNSTYIVINSRSIDPTRYNDYYRNSYQRGDYRQQERRVYQAPPGRLPFYRPSAPSENQNQGREVAPENRNPNYNNNGERKAFPSQTPGARQMQPTPQPQNTNNEGARRNESQPSSMPQQKVETRQQPVTVPTQVQESGRMPAAQQQINNPPIQNRTENYRQEMPQPQRKEVGRTPQRRPQKRQEIKSVPQKREAPPVEEKVQTRQQ
jgi:hypothetical protein